MEVPGSCGFFLDFRTQLEEVIGFPKGVCGRALADLKNEWEPHHAVGFHETRMGFQERLRHSG